MRTLALAGLLTAAASSTRPCRDRWLEPFHASSIWNTAIGSEAQYMPALIYHNMTRERGCGLRISSVSRRRQCPGVSKFASQQVGRSVARRPPESTPKAKGSAAVPSHRRQPFIGSNARPPGAATLASPRAPSPAFCPQGCPRRSSTTTASGLRTARPTTRSCRGSTR